MDCRQRIIGSCTVICLFTLAVFCPSGCVPTGGTTEPLVITVAPGGSFSGDLFTGQAVAASVPVEAGHTYALQAALIPSTAGSVATGDIVGTISGDPLAEPLEFFVTVVLSTALDISPTPVLFAPDLDGEVVIEFLYPATATTGIDSPGLDAIRALTQGPLHATLELSVTDLGFDDNGSSIESAVTLEVGIENERTGSLSPGDEADYFVADFEAGKSYRIGLESSDVISVVSGGVDRFGWVNFGIPTLGGLIINVGSAAGIPGEFEFACTASEEVFLRLTAFGGGGVDPTTEVGINYAIYLVDITADGG